MNIADRIADLKGTTITVGPKVMQRGIADIIEKHVCDTVAERLYGEPEIETQKAKSKRSIEDITVKNKADTFYVDVKTSDLDAKFSMPNLISVNRLQKLYEDPKSVVLLIFVDYQKIDDETIIIRDIKQARIEEIDMSCLHVQNLGKGQLQLRNKMTASTDNTLTRAEWFQALVDIVIEFKIQLVKKTQEDLVFWSGLRTQT